MRVLQRGRGVGMIPDRSMLRLLSLGAGPRIAGAAIVIALLWAGFLWAIATPGGS